MALSVKKLTSRPERLAPGHRACAGCTAPIALRHALRATEGNLVIGFATGCMEVSTTIYPFTSWRTSYIHNAFENVAATISGVETAYRALKKRGRMKADHKFIAFGGDGGTYDIGLQSLSGALERGHNMVYICYDNEAYMNTGIQRSGSTPLGAHTMTAQAGTVKQGKEQLAKDLTQIVIAHNIPYVAQASIHNVGDYASKVEKALNVQGPAFINVLTPCHRGWRCKVEDSVEVARVAVETCFWPLFEVEDHKWKVNYKPKEKRPITDWLKMQGRFKHLFDGKRDDIIQRLQEETDRRWAAILKRAEESAAAAPAQGKPQQAP